MSRTISWRTTITRGPQIILLLLLVVPLVQGAGVTVAPRESSTNPGVTFKNAYGYVNLTITETFSGIGPLSKLGAFYFNVTGYELQVQIYKFTIVPFGNGTMVLRFPGISPFKVLHSASSTESYDGSNHWESLSYTTSQTDPVQLIYVGSVKSNIQNSAWGLASIFGIIGLVVGILWIKMDLEQPEHAAILGKKKDLLRALVLICIALTLMFSMTALFS